MHGPPSPPSPGDEAAAGFDFLAELRHELRTPLTAIVGYTELILEEAEPTVLSVVGEDIATIVVVARRLLSTIDSQLRSHLIESGSISLSELRFAMRTAADELHGVIAVVVEEVADLGDDAVRRDVGRVSAAMLRLTALLADGLTSTSVAAGAVASRGEEEDDPDRSDVLAGRILIADDNPDNRELLTRRLTQQGHEVVAVSDGGRALEILSRETFDLLLLDIMMPFLNGFEVLRRLRSGGRLRTLPVIIISALDDIESVERCLRLGAVEHLSKPFNPVILNARISATLAVKRLRDRADAYLETIEAELKTARDLQLMMLPPALAGDDLQGTVTVAGHLDPARRVGGDLYDYFVGADGRFYFLISDVCGKGIPAAIYMTRAKTLFRVLGARAASGEIAGAARFLGAMNEELAHENPSLMFVTALLGVLDPVTGETDLANAGHTFPVLVAADEAPAFLTVPRGLPLGLAAGLVYASRRVMLGSSSTMVLYTDGVIDARGPEAVPFGNDRLLSTLAAAGTVDPQALTDSLAAAIDGHAGSEEPFDDVTIMAVHFQGRVR
jgi:sigma-B regulation protein RsbU (phosphoserine phosphatase)